MSDHVDLDAQQVSNGAAQWAAASAGLSALQRAISDITCMNAASPWGFDKAGSTFKGAYNPEPVLDAAPKIVNEVTELGPKVVSALGYSMAADEQAAVEMLKPAEQLPPAADAVIRT